MTGAETTWRTGDEPRRNRLLLAGFVVSILILIATAALSTWNHMQLVSIQEAVRESQELLRQIAEFNLNLLEMRDAHRSFLIAGEPGSLQAYDAATNRLAQLLVDMRKHLQPDALQQTQYQRLLPTLGQTLSLLHGNLEARRHRPFDVTAELAAMEAVKPTMDALRSLVAEISREEFRQLAERGASSVQAERVAFWFNNSGRVLSIFLFTGVFFGLLHENRLRRQREVELRRAAAELERRVTDRTAELHEKNKELETVVYVVSHDLRSPLLNVQGFARRLDRACQSLREFASSARDGVVPVSDLKPVLQESIPQALGFIEAGVKRMDQLLAGFLRYSRLGRVALNIAPIEMNGLLADVVQSMRFQVDQAQAEFCLEPLPPCLGDATQTTQVFFNLLDNALKYRDAARPLRVTISGREEGDRSVYRVSDNGIGIAPEHQPKVFEIFHRLNPDQTPGEGLGLTIAQRILERQAGKIWLESQPGAGSTFFVALPRPAPDA